MKICVMIASYRDRELLQTIESCLEKADKPEAIGFAICWQGTEKEDYQKEQLRLIKNCKVAYYTAEDSKGVGWARNICYKLVDDQDYVLQIDSHSQLVKSWDSEMIAMLESLPKRSLLTAYPASYNPTTRELQPDAKPYSIGANYFDDYGVLILQAVTEVKKQPARGAFLSAGFFFAPKKIIGISYDPYIIFNGEESSLAVRLITNGWNIYHPNKVLVYHNYEREFAPRLFTDFNKYQEELASYERYQRIMEGIWDYGEYGLGQELSIKEYQNRFGIDFKNKIITDNCKMGFFL